MSFRSEARNLIEWIGRLPSGLRFLPAATLESILLVRNDIPERRKKRDLLLTQVPFPETFIRSMMQHHCCMLSSYFAVLGMLPLCRLLLFPILRFSLLRSLFDDEELCDPIFFSFSRLLWPLCFVVGITSDI